MQYEDKLSSLCFQISGRQNQTLSIIQTVSRNFPDLTYLWTLVFQHDVYILYPTKTQDRVLYSLFIKKQQKYHISIKTQSLYWVLSLIFFRPQFQLMIEGWSIPGPSTCQWGSFWGEASIEPLFIKPSSVESSSSVCPSGSESHQDLWSSGTVTFRFLVSSH